MTKDQKRRRNHEIELGLRPGEKAKQGLDIPPMNSIGWTWIINLVLAVLKVIMPVLSPTLREELNKLMLSLYEKAMATDNPWDDFLMRFLLRILGIPVPA